jgi:hypothetical protein
MSSPQPDVLENGINLKDYSHVLAGVESGIKHVHPLGLVHNDINPVTSCWR